jgi:hypothetical protein
MSEIKAPEIKAPEIKASVEVKPEDKVLHDYQEKLRGDGVVVLFCITMLLYGLFGFISGGAYKEKGSAKDWSIFEGTFTILFSILSIIYFFWLLTGCYEFITDLTRK